MNNEVFFANVALWQDIRDNGNNWEKHCEQANYETLKHIYHPIQYYINIMGHRLKRTLHFYYRVTTMTSKNNVILNSNMYK